MNCSGPVFATIGFVVRLRQSGSKDTTWNQCGILLWAAAELATGNLCVCFPELVYIFRKRNRRVPGHPSASQIQRGWDERVIRKPSEPYFNKSLFSTVMSSKSTVLSSKDDEDWYELRRYDHVVQIIPTNRFEPAQEVEDGVIVLQNEVKVERLGGPL